MHVNKTVFEFIRLSVVLHCHPRVGRIFCHWGIVRRIFLRTEHSSLIAVIIDAVQLNAFTAFKSCRLELFQ